MYANVHSVYEKAKLGFPKLPIIVINQKKIFRAVLIIFLIKFLKPLSKSKITIHFANL